MGSAIKKCTKYIKNPREIVRYLLNHGVGELLPDKLYITMMFKLKVGYPIDWDNPRGYNEKLQWLKLYDRNPEYTNLVDKYEVRQYVADTIGEEYLFPLYGVWDKFEEIDFDKLPEQFVLKCTHDSGGVIVCKEKKDFDYSRVSRFIKKRLKVNYYKKGREFPYKYIKPRIIIEKYMEDESNKGLKDYKFFVFNGVVKALFVATERFSETETCFDFFDRDFNHLPMRQGHPNSNTKITKPDNYEKMIELAEKLGKGFPHVRVDLYNIDGRIYFGEMTFFHYSGFTPFEPVEFDYSFGDWICLEDEMKR